MRERGSTFSRAIRAWQRWRELRKAARLIRQSTIAFDAGRHRHARAFLDQAGVILARNRDALG